jgi:hypothetical protein
MSDERAEMMGTCELTAAQVAELEALGYSLTDAYSAVKHYTDGFVAAPNFEATKKALVIHKDTDEWPTFDWYENL